MGAWSYACIILFNHKASLVAQMLKNSPTIQETEFNPWIGKIPWRRKWQPTPLFLFEKSHGQKNLESYGFKKLQRVDTAGWLTHWTQTWSNSMRRELLFLGNKHESQRIWVTCQRSELVIHMCFLFNHTASNTGKMTQYFTKIVRN